MNKNLLLATALVLLLTACRQKPALQPEPGEWLFELQLGAVPLRFRAEWAMENDSLLLYICNAEERIRVDEIRQDGDSIFVMLPVFDSEFRGKMLNARSIQGNWINRSRTSDNVVFFTARQSARSGSAQHAPQFNAGGRWSVRFSPGAGREYPAVAVFKQEGKRLSGTFLTETGDYRYLAGSVQDSNLYLSTFDGSHAFVFTATLKNDSILKGIFYSGSHWQEPWEARRNDSASLRDPYSLTYLNPGFDRLAFRFPDLNGDTVALEGPRFHGKVVIVQLMGSWCPNCLDESILLNEWHRRYRSRGLEVIALCYERTGDFAKAAALVKRLQKRLGSEYTYLIAATTADKKAAASTLPMLNQVMAFPTAIFLDRSGRVRKIYTGFNGPGTGELYLRYIQESERLIEDLLRQPG